MMATNTTVAIILTVCAFLLYYIAVVTRSQNNLLMLKTKNAPRWTYDEQHMHMWRMGHYHWLEYLSKLDPGKLALLTLEVQKWIFEKLHPPLHLCNQSKYMIIGTHQAGLGSIMHVATYHMALALEHGYQIVWHPGLGPAGTHYADIGCGRNQSVHNFLCYFQPPSSCGYEHVTSKNSITASINMTTFDQNMNHGSIPHYWRNRLRKALPEMSISQSYIKFWWRAQGAAYLMRLNAETSDELRKMRLDNQLHMGYRFYKDSSVVDVVPVPFPLPHGTINAHVRHGDKGGEMSLVPYSKYLNAARTIVVENLFKYSSIFFVTTEDEAVVAEAKKTNPIQPMQTTPFLHWTVIISNIHRQNGGPMAQLQRFGKGTMTREWLLQLLMALECDAFVGTLGSNWNRLIAELRCVWLAKCDTLYQEVGFAKDWMNYSW